MNCQAAREGKLTEEGTEIADLQGHEHTQQCACGKEPMDAQAPDGLEREKRSDQDMDGTYG